MFSRVHKWVELAMCNSAESFLWTSWLFNKDAILLILYCVTVFLYNNGMNVLSWQFLG